MRIFPLAAILSLGCVNPAVAQQPPKITLHIEVNARSWTYENPPASWRDGDLALRSGKNRIRLTIQALPKASSSQPTNPALATHLLVVLPPGADSDLDAPPIASFVPELQKAYKLGWQVSVVRPDSSATPYTSNEQQLQQELFSLAPRPTASEAVTDLLSFAGRRILISASRSLPLPLLLTAQQDLASMYFVTGMESKQGMQPGSLSETPAGHSARSKEIERPAATYTQGREDGDLPLPSGTGTLESAGSRTTATLGAAFQRAIEDRRSYLDLEAVVPSASLGGLSLHTRNGQAVIRSQAYIEGDDGRRTPAAPELKTATDR